ncbi:MAG: ATP-binding cassette domain-containing protein, partial [Clostridia bacterium]|nr:ATP-binding cassette domain-containing protein [Clostridia bacterium]
MRVNEAIVEFKHISMQFPGVLANDDVSLRVNKGEIFALVGENGAGKSTLMNILYGLNQPTSGELFIKGTAVGKNSPSTAISLGVGMVHQHFKLVPSFTVAQNIVLAREPVKRKVFYDFKESVEIVRRLTDEYGLEIDPEARVEELSIGLEQRVEILKTLFRGADILILDEPTAVLTPHETSELFAVLRRMVREKGMTVIIITHKLYEVMEISDRVGVMRAGKLVGVVDTEKVDERTLASMMVGREMLLSAIEHNSEAGESVIEVRNLRVLSDRGIEA